MPTGKKALVIGPRTPDFDNGYNRSVARALEVAGYAPTVAEFATSTPTGLINRLTIDLPMALGIDTGYVAYRNQFNQRVCALYQDLQPDIVFVIRGSKLDAATLHEMRGAPRILWCQDAVRRCDLTGEQIAAYDHILVFEKSDVEYLRRLHGREAHFLPLGFDPDIYRPIPPDARDVDIFFVGAHYPRRIDILEGLERAFRHRKLRFYGRFLRYREPASYLRLARYAGTGRLEAFRNRPLSPAAINRMYNRSKICINIHHEQSEQGCNPRVFEIMGAGGFQLTDTLPYITRELGSAVETYADPQELHAKVERYLADPTERTRIAAEGHRLALANHTFAHRIEQALSLCR